VTFVYSPKRREVLKVAGAAVAVAATADAEAQMAGGKIKAIGFDAFTIFDVRSIDAAFEDNFPGRAKEIAATWRTRLFEYTWLRTLNRTYADLEQVSEDALTFACKSAKIELSPEAPGKILDAFLQLKPFPDSVGALKAMRGAGIRLAYVSDFTPRILKAITENAGVADLFEPIGDGI
jgi:2-haloacid dehalogenase